MLVEVADDTESLESVVANNPLNTADEDVDAPTVLELAELVEAELIAKSAVLALSNDVSEDFSTVLVLEDSDDVDVDVPKTEAPVASLEDFMASSTELVESAIIDDSVDDEAELKRSSTDGDTVGVFGVDELTGTSVLVVDKLVGVSAIEELWENSVDPDVY